MGLEALRTRGASSGLGVAGGLQFSSDGAFQWNLCGDLKSLTQRGPGKPGDAGRFWETLGDPGRPYEACCGPVLCCGDWEVVPK